MVVGQSGKFPEQAISPYEISYHVHMHMPSYSMYSQIYNLNTLATIHVKIDDTLP